VRTLGPVVLLLILAVNSFATTAIVQSSVYPEPGVLALLGGGLVGIAALVRRHLRN
jgi:PEP-CTERM motif